MAGKTLEARAQIALKRMGIPEPTPAIEPGTIKKAMDFVTKFLPLLGAAGAGGGAAAGGAAAGATAGQVAGAALNVASNLSESKRNAKAISRIGAAMKHAKKIA